MFTTKRHEVILDILKNKGAVTTADLASRFNVSAETVRRDLLEMEHKQLLNRVHGGAVSVSEMIPDLSLIQRTHEFEEEKRYLSEVASQFINEGDIIGVDSGSTAVLFSQMLKENFKHLTVITYSADVFLILRDTEFNIILCGGNYYEEENCFIGALTLEAFQKVCMKKSFICPSATSLKYGIGIYNQELYMIQKYMMSSSEKVFILADSSKFEKRALLVVDEMKPEYVYITDNKLNSELMSLYKENGLEIHNSL